MILIKVKYDAYNRHFILLDREMAHSLDDGETYMLIADASIQDLALRHEEKGEPAKDVEGVLA
ncbi:MAG TPA: hypothetical protein VER98_12930 [Terriglobia bacterium]|nr:hypothetical protein [Terriglobia bacterium]